jgi:hypothetical protein
MSQQVWHDKDPSLLKGDAKLKFCSPSPAMVTSPCGQKILLREVKQYTINPLCRPCLIQKKISKFLIFVIFSMFT